MLYIILRIIYNGVTSQEGCQILNFLQIVVLQGIGFTWFYIFQGLSFHRPRGRNEARLKKVPTDLLRTILTNRPVFRSGSRRRGYFSF